MKRKKKTFGRTHGKKETTNRRVETTLDVFIVYAAMNGFVRRSCLIGAGSAGLVHRGGTETESRGASRDMDPAWGHGEGRKEKKQTKQLCHRSSQRQRKGIGGA